LDLFSFIAGGFVGGLLTWIACCIVVAIEDYYRFRDLINEMALENVNYNG